MDNLDPIIQEIDSIVGRINTHPEYSACALRENSHIMREEAEKHSLDIEVQNEGKILNKKERSRSLNHINNASSFLTSEGLDMYSLSKLGGLVQPRTAENRPNNGFRKEDIAFGPFVLSDWSRIPYQLDSLLYFLNNTSVHPVLKASNSHLETVMIHPYLDGNGRVARLVQTHILQKRGYPPAVLSSDRRKEYLQIVGGALKDRYDGKSSFSHQSIAEQRFHELIASEVLDSSISLEQELMKRRSYCVHLDKIKDQGIAITVAGRLRNLSRQKNDGKVSVSQGEHNSKHSETLNVIGDLSYGDIDTYLRKDSKRYGFKYNIERGYC